MDHHAATFRSRFWLSLVLTVPVVAFSPMFADLLGYSPPSFPGADLVSPVLGTAVFLYGGWPFLTGGWTELRQRTPVVAANAQLLRRLDLLPRPIEGRDAASVPGQADGEG